MGDFSRPLLLQFFYFLSKSLVQMVLLLTANIFLDTRHIIFRNGKCSVAALPLEPFTGRDQMSDQV